MKYIKFLNITSFRGIRELELLDLGEVNILVGENNSGKTSILEAIGIMENPTELGSIIRIGRKREIFNNQSSPYTIFKNILNASTKSVCISGNVKGKRLNIGIDGKSVSLLTEEAYSQVVEGFQGKINVNYGEHLISEDITIFQNDNDFIMGSNSSRKWCFVN